MAISIGESGKHVPYSWLEATRPPLPPLAEQDAAVGAQARASLPPLSDDTAAAAAAAFTGPPKKPKLVQPAPLLNLWQSSSSSSSILTVSDGAMERRRRKEPPLHPPSSAARPCPKRSVLSPPVPVDLLLRPRSRGCNNTRQHLGQGRRLCSAGIPPSLPALRESHLPFPRSPPSQHSGLLSPKILGIWERRQRRFL